MSGNFTEPLLTAREVTEILRIDQSTIYKWADEGRLPYIDLGVGKKRCLRFKLADIKALVESRTVDNGARLKSEQNFVINKVGVVASPRKGGKNG
jgi:excisionase family DNA binding protein